MSCRYQGWFSWVICLPLPNQVWKLSEYRNICECGDRLGLKDLPGLND